MIKRYLNHVRSKQPHHRRQHAAQVAGVLTIVAFVIWITTLPLRFGGTGQVAGAADSLNASDNQTMLAGAAGRDYANSTDGTTDDGSGVQVVGTSTAGDTTSSQFSNY